MKFVNCNGKLVAENEPLFTAANRGFRYGDGVFETMKVAEGNINLSAFHFDRLFTSLLLLQINKPPDNFKETIEKNIEELCRLNNCFNLARVRLAIYRSNENEAHYVIEAIELEQYIANLNEGGWKLGLFPSAQKSCDAFANLKSANFLPYVLAQLHADDNNLNESLILNSSKNIADGSKTNLFFIKDAELYTPELNQGCVNGVMRRYVIEECKKNGWAVHQVPVTVEMLEAADEVFVTNAIQQIKWVESFGEKKYKNATIQILYKQLFSA